MPTLATLGMMQAHTSRSRYPKTRSSGSSTLVLRMLGANMRRLLLFSIWRSIFALSLTISLSYSAYRTAMMEWFSLLGTLLRSSLAI
jgi:hypothetical protein